MADEIFSEVDNELRAERLRQLAKRFGLVGIGIAILAGAGFGGWEYHVSQEHARAEQASLIYLKGLHDSGSDSGIAGLTAPLTDVQKKALASLQKMGQTAQPGIAALARLRVAAADASHGKLQDALATWDALSQDARLDQNMRDLAALLWCQWQTEYGDPATVRSRLSLLTGKNGTYAPLANELLASLDIRTGQTQAARERLEKMSQDYSAPDGVRMRANALLQTLDQQG